MRKGLAGMAVLGILVAGLSGSFAWAKSGREIPARDRTIVRVYYLNLTTGNKVVISFKAQLLETNYEEGYHVMEVTQREMDLLIRAGLRVEADHEWMPEHCGIPLCRQKGRSTEYLGTPAIAPWKRPSPPRNRLPWTIPISPPGSTVVILGRSHQASVALT
jgi:hypothetical protein